MAKRVHVDISIFGDKELQRRLKALPINMEKKIVRQALRKAAKPILATARALAPVKTGRMRDTMHIRALRPLKRRHMFGVQVMTGTRAELGIAPEDPYYYPMGVEVGHGTVPAHPFMRPALDRHRARTYALVAALIREGVTDRRFIEG